MKTSPFYSIAIFAFIFSFAFSSCSNGYLNAKTVTSQSKYPGVIERAKKDQRYFILQSGINVYNITSVDLDKAKKEMTVTLDKVDSSRLVNVKNVETNGYQLKKGEDSVLSKIYLYMKDSTSYTFDEPHTIPLDKVSRVELLE
ncbi:hypothetical protein [Segetibacter koreensis]|uniref:hypothetical protein n=1 Tax=Segetibacter koreensis TaxID=398037 RepID=UPI00037A02C4|nr:hypothetical protein [Segetibacter koreensis]